MLTLKGSSNDPEVKNVILPNNNVNISIYSYKLWIHIWTLDLDREQVKSSPIFLSDKHKSGYLYSNFVLIYTPFLGEVHLGGDYKSNN